jgi:uncharacterized phage protein (TIGR01671 family)
MRDIKFRIFDTKTRTMNYAPTTTSVPEPQRRGLNECIYSFGQRIMQFTGLHDKNGREIYEGDIVRVEYSDGGTEHFTVEYSEYFCRYQFVTSTGDGYAIDPMGEPTVVGNIYENPELLK